MNNEIGNIAFAFARRKIRFHLNEHWEDIKLFGLFYWSDVSKYLVGNPSKIKSWKRGLITTNMRKENKIIWCNPTKDFWDNYIQPIMNNIKDFSLEHKVCYLEEGFLMHKDEYKHIKG